MRADGIKPRVGIVVAFCSIFLVFGFMFTISGTKGESLGPVPLIALGPAIFLPGVGIIILASKTEGFRIWPWSRPPGCPCRCLCCICAAKPVGEVKKSKGRGCREEDLEGLCGSDSGSSSTSLEKSKQLVSLTKEKQDEVLHYLKTCYHSSALDAVHGTSSEHCVFDGLCSVKNSVPYTHTPYSTTHLPRGSLIVYVGQESTPYGVCCYYGNPQRFSRVSETVV